MVVSFDTLGGSALRNNVKRPISSDFPVAPCSGNPPAASAESVPSSRRRPPRPPRGDSLWPQPGPGATQWPYEGGKRDGIRTDHQVRDVEDRRDEAVGDEWEAAIGADRKAVRRVMCKDRDSDSRYFNIVFFDSYEEAMENSKHAVTQEFSAKMMALGDGEPTFYNLDVLDDRTS